MDPPSPALGSSNGPGSASSFTPSSGPSAAQAASPTLFSEAQQAKYMDYLFQRMDKVDQEAIRQQVAQFTQQIAQQDKRMAMLDLPMLDIQKQALANTIAKDAADTALKWAAQDLQEGLGRGQLALSASGQMAAEAISREGIAQKGYAQADQMELARQALATSQFGQAEQQGLARQTAGANASDAAQDNILAAESLGAGTLAAKMNDQALEAAKIAAGLRGPRDAFHQQNVMWGMNQSGLSKAVDALKGMPGVTAYQAPQMRPERATMATLADQMSGAGGGPSGTTPWDLMMEVATRNVRNPIGIGTENLLTVGDRNIGQQYSPYAQAAGQQGFANAQNPFSDAYNATMDQAQRNEATTYSTPSSQMAQQVGAPNVNAAAPVNDQDIIKSGNDAFGTAWNTLVHNANAAGTSVTDQQAIDLLKQTYQLTDQQAAALHMQNKDMFVGAAGAPTVERIGQMAGIIKQNTALGNVSSPVGAAQRTIDDYTAMRQRLGPNIAHNDPRVIDLIMSDQGVDRETARQLAEQYHTIAATTGRAPTIGEMAPRIAQSGGGYTGQMVAPAQSADATRYALDGYKAALKEFNAPFLSENDPRMITRLQDATRLTAQGAQALAKMNADYYRQNGVAAPDSVIEANLNQVRTQYGADAGARQQWGAGSNRWAYPTQAGKSTGPPSGAATTGLLRTGTDPNAGRASTSFSTPKDGAGAFENLEADEEAYAEDPIRKASRFSTPRLKAA